MFFTPQMAPINWLILFIMFNMIMILFISNNYFSSLYMIKNKSNLKNKKFYWKW